jgi:succinyl-CoA synthetase beta subunit
MTRLLEDLSLETIDTFGVPVPTFTTVSSAEEAAAFVSELGRAAVLKALVPAGGRQKGGFVHFAATPEQARTAANSMLGREFKRFPVESLLISEQLPIRREFFLSITFDSTLRAPSVIFSSKGGVDIEQIAREHPTALIRQPVNVALGLRPFEARQAVSRAGLSGRCLLKTAGVLIDAYRAFRASDARLVEINPLVELDDRRIVAASALLTLDDQAKYRQPALYAKNRQDPNNGWRPLTPLEREIRAIDEADPNVGNIRFNEFEDGDIAMMVTGGGGGLTALDAMNRAGGKPATTFDIKIGPIEEKMYHATRAVLARPGLRGLVVGANFSNFTGIDIKVRGVVRALRDAAVDTRQFPVVMRFCGPNQAVANELAATVPGLEFMDERYTLEDAVDRVVARINEAGDKPE